MVKQLQFLFNCIDKYYELNVSQFFFLNSFPMCNRIDTKYNISIFLPQTMCGIKMITVRHAHLYVHTVYTNTYTR